MIGAGLLPAVKKKRESQTATPDFRRLLTKDRSLWGTTHQMTVMLEACAAVLKPLNSIEMPLSPAL